MADLYDRVKKWKTDFEQRHKTAPIGNYYADAASGLIIALQEIDAERFKRERES